MEVEKNQKKSPWWKKILKIIGILILLFLIFIVYGRPFYKLLVVTSDSMSPTFNAGDLICIIDINPNEAKVGDITTFQTMEGELVTHRIVKIEPDGEVITKGDANNAADSWSDNWKLKAVNTKYIFRISKIGYVISWLEGLKGQSTSASYKDSVTVINNKITADTSSN